MAIYHGRKGGDSPVVWEEELIIQEEVGEGSLQRKDH